MNIWWLAPLILATIACPLVVLTAVRVRSERLTCEDAVARVKELAAAAPSAGAGVGRERLRG